MDSSQPGTLHSVLDFAPAISLGRWLLHISLFALTLLTTTMFGAAFALAFHQRLPLESDWLVKMALRAATTPSLLVGGLPFSLTLLTILFAHEMGHYVTCMHYRIDASLPYFLPAPTLIGTLGAFIRIRSPIYTRRALFDVGIAGPIAGFVLIIPALAIGMAMSHVTPGLLRQGDIAFGVPLLLRGCEALFFPGVRPEDVYLHPMALAAWVGMLATALNLLPIGQLDGGHILYSVIGERHKLLSRIFVVALVVLGRVTNNWTWYIMAGLLLLFALRHPVIFDTRPLDRSRVILAWCALLMLVLCFTPSPIR